MGLHTVKNVTIYMQILIELQVSLFDGLNSGLVLNCNLLQVIMASRFIRPGGACQVDLNLNFSVFENFYIPMGLGKFTG